MLKDKFEQISKALSRTFSESHLEVSPFVMSYYPRHDFKSQQTRLVVSLVSNVINRIDGSAHTVVVGVSAGDIELWCGDVFVSGQLEGLEKNRRVEAAANDAQAAARAEVMFQIDSLHGSIQAINSNCDFRQQNILMRGNYHCEHCQAVMVALSKQPGLINDAQVKLQWAMDPLNNTLGTATALRLETVSIEELAFKKPILIEGDRGAGKTFAARKYAKMLGIKPIELGGNHGVETQDMLGYLIPYGKDNLIWKDGPIAAAFRHAKKTKTILIIDELLRIPERELSLLLTALTPDEGVYRLRTGRIIEVIDGIGSEEVLECPKENLAVIANTNVGIGYSVSSMDPSISERFFILRKDTEEAELHRILVDLTGKRNFAYKQVQFLIKFWKAANELQLQGQLHLGPSTRTMADAIELAADSKDVSRMVKNMYMQWVARDQDGRPIAEQKAIVDELVEGLVAELGLV